MLEPATVIQRYEPSQDFMNSLISVTMTAPESFLIVKENLTRIGIKAKYERRLCQSCHILKKRDKFYLMHFKELFLLDGKQANFTEEDKGRRNTIIQMLSDWKLLTIDDPNKIVSPRALVTDIHIIPHNQKIDWVLESKYQIGKKRHDHVGS